MAIRHVGQHTKMTIRWEPAGRHAPSWVVGNYKVSFNVNGRKMDNVILHVFNEPTATGRTPEELGLSERELGTPRGYDVAAKWAMEDLISGSKAAPHWRYGRAKSAATALWSDLAENDHRVRRSK